MRKIMIAAAVLAAPLLMSPLQADDHEQAAPEMLDQTWHQVNFIRFHEGKQARAAEIIAMFEQASAAVGQDNPMALHMNTGPYHMVVAFPMKHGVAQMGWKETPEDKAWDAAFANIAGGEEQAAALFAEFSSLIAERQRHVGHTH